MNSPDPAIRPMPMKASSVGQSPNTMKLNRTAQNMAVYSKGATKLESARR